MLSKKYNLLLKSFDAGLTVDEQKQLDAALGESEALRLEQEQLIVIRQALWTFSTPGFRPFFSERIIAKIKASKEQVDFEPFFESLKLAFRPLAISALVLIIGMMSFNAIQNNESFISSLLPSEETSLEQAFDPTLTYFQE
ncbi:hypothetical protein ACFL4L_05645 [bacterium]